MINLLFISNSPRAELLRVHFQQILKIRIEVVEDFDRGLKDVFEKRPVAVCIQDQIAGVTGESVARHIQLLLSNGAPGFILMHDGSSKAKIVPGLFDQLVDLSAPFDVVCQTLHKALQAHLGDHWDKVYTPLPQEVAKPDVGMTSSLADQLVDEFISEDSAFNPQHAPPLPGMDVFSSSSDSPFVQEQPGGPPAENQAALVETEARIAATEPAQPPDPLPVYKAAPKIPRNPVKTVPKPERPLLQVEAVPSSAAAKTTVAADDVSVPVDELLQAFEENYRNSKRLRLRIVFAVVGLLIVRSLAWVLLNGRFRKVSTVPVTQQPVVKTQQQPAVQPLVSSARQIPRSAPAVASKTYALPSFIPKSGHDAAYSKNKPGWSRYLTEHRDYRLFLAEGRLKALQVLVVGNDTITPAELKLVLRELTGIDEYRLDSKETKRGLRLERATVPGHAELLMYRSTSRGPIKAFVLQLTP